MSKLLKSIFLLFFLVSISLFSEVKGIGVILPDSQNNFLLRELKSELKTNFEGSELSIDIADISYSNKESLERGIERLNKNSKVDVIFILDYHISEIEKLKKSSKLIIYPFGLAKLNKNPGKNIMYIYSEPDYISDLKKLNEITPFKKLTFIIGDSLIKNSSEEILKMKNEMNKLGIKVSLVNSSESLEKINKELDDSEAVYLITNSKVNLDVAKLALSKKIPTFFVSFCKETNDKVLLGYDFNLEIKKRIRTSVFNYSNLLKGKEETSVLNLGKVVGDRFYNVKIAEEIKIYPGALVIQSLKHVGTKAEIYKKLNMKEAVKIGVDNNPLLVSKFKNMLASNYSYLSQNAQRLPQVGVAANYSYLDKRIVSPISGPEDRVVGGLKITQVLFDDELNAQIFSEKVKYKNSQLNFEEQLRTTVYDILVAYLNVLQAKSELDIQNSNFVLAKEFLRISKIKYETGASGIQDVYRLESSLSTAISQVSKSETSVKNAEAKLNALLNLPVNTKHSYQNLEELDNEFYFAKNELNKLVYNENKNKKMLDFITQGAFNNSNILKAYENNIKSVNNQYKTVSRSRFIPKVSAFGEYSKNNMIEPWGKGQEYNSPNNWRAGVAVELPLFTSGEIYYNQKSLKVSEESIESEKLNFENSLHQEVNTSYNNLINSYIRIHTSKNSAESAEKYLKIAKNLYANGSINITEILDAQNASISANLSNSIDNYNFFISAINIEKIYGKYMLLESNENRKSMLNRVINITEN